MHTLLIRKATLTFLGFVGVGILYLLFASPVFATPNNTVFIPATHNIGNTNTCTVDSVGGECYSTIQAAIDDALTDAVIKVGPGTYYPTSANPYHSSSVINVNKKVSIVGDNKNSVIVQPATGQSTIGSNGDVLSTGNSVFLINAEGVSISRLTIQGDNPSTGGSPNARNGIIYNYNNGANTLVGLYIDNVVLTNLGHRGVHVQKNNGNMYEVRVTNSTISSIAGSGSAAGVEVIGAKDNIYVNNSSFSSMATGVKGSNGSDVLVHDNVFSSINRAVEFINQTGGGANAYLNNVIGTPNGSNHTAFYIQNHVNNVVIMGNHINDFSKGIDYVINSTPYSGQLRIYENFFTNNGTAITLTESTPVTTNIEIGRNGDGNIFSGNSIDLRLVGVNENIPANYNVWSGGSTWPQIEPYIHHKGLLPSGLGSYADSNDNAALGQVMYTSLSNAQKSISLKFPSSTYPKTVYGNTETITLVAEATFDPYMVGSVNFRIGYKGNPSQDTCQELYSLSSGGSYNLGNHTSSNGNNYSITAPLSAFTIEGQYIICAFMEPGSGVPSQGYSLSTTSSATVTIDTSPPPPPETGSMGWVNSNPPSNTNDVSQASGYRPCGGWVNRTMVSSGVIVWNPVVDGLSDIGYYEIQLYSLDYGPGTLNSVQNTGENNWYQLPLVTTGVDDGDYYIRTRATDSSGNTGPWSNTSSNPTDWCRFRIDTQLPSVSTPNYTLTEGSGNLTITATGSDANGITKYEWDLDNNNSYEVDTGTTTSTIMSSSNFIDGPITRTFKVRATDTAGNTAVDTSTVGVSNVTPGVNLISNSSIVAGGVASFSGSFTDPGSEGTWTVTINYGIGNQHQMTVNSAGNVTIPGRQYNTAGTYTITMTVSDGESNSSDNIQLTVLPAQSGNIGVAITANPVIPVTGQSVAFNSVISNPNNVTITGYSWNFGDGSTANTPNANHSFATVGTYTVTLNVTTSGGQFSANAEIVVVSPTDPNAPANPGGVDLGPNQTVPPNIEITINADTFGLPDNLTFHWNFGDGTTATTTVPYVNHIYGAPGTYPVEVTVEGAPGGPITDDMNVTVDEDAERSVLDNNAGDVAGAGTTGSVFEPTIFGMAQSTFLELLLLIIIVGGGGAIAYLYWKRKKDAQSDLKEPNYSYFNRYNPTPQGAPIGMGMNAAPAGFSYSNSQGGQSNASPAAPQPQQQPGRFKPNQQNPMDIGPNMGFSPYS